MATGGKKWLAYGCVGCLGIIGLFLVLGAFVFGTAFVGVRGEQVAEETLTHDLPAPPEAEEREPAASAPTALPGRVVLELADGEFEIEPGRPGEPIAVEARYDTKTYDLREKYEEGEDGWTYEVRFLRTGSGIVSILKQALGGTSPKVRVFLPVDVPIALEFRLERGGSQVELGGLWLTEADLDFKMGGVMVSVGEPLREPMERLTLHASMGGGAFSSIGNASPRELDVYFSMGGMDLDLEGRWLQDSNISIEHSMGGASVRLPRDVKIVGLDTGRRIRAPEESEISPPTLTFTVKGSMDDLEFR